MSAGAALRAESADRRATRRIGQLFFLGSALFAIGSLPGIRDEAHVGTAAVLFAGSIFFTAAAAEPASTCSGRSPSASPRSPPTSSTHEPVSLAVSSWGTLIGALCFAAAALLLIPRGVADARHAP